MTNNLTISRELLNDLLDSARLEVDERIRSFGEDYRPHVLASLRKMVADAEAILAAPAVERQAPFAWFTEDYLTDKSSTTYDELTSNRWKEKGWPVQTLFTSPPAPVALTDSFVQPVPDKCDRITWRGSYYHLPPAPVAVVLPISIDVEDSPFYSSTTEAAYGYRDGFNACLDKVKEMNQ